MKGKHGGLTTCRAGALFLAAGVLLHGAAARADCAPAQAPRDTPAANDTIVVRGIPPPLSRTLGRALAGGRQSQGKSCPRVVERLRSLPGVRSLRTRTTAVSDGTVVQLLGSHGTVVRGALEPRTLPGRSWEPGARLRVDSAFRCGERWLARAWKSRERRDETASANTDSPIAEIALLLPLYYRTIESIGLQVAFMHGDTGDRACEPIAEHARSTPYAPSSSRYLFAARLASHACPGATTLAIFVDAGNGVRAGSVLAREVSHRAASCGMQIDNYGRAGVRSLLALRRGRNILTLEAALSHAGSSVAMPVTRSAWADVILERERAPVYFAKAEYERFLLRGPSLVVSAKVEFIRTDQRGWAVPVLASTSRVLGQRFTAEAAFNRGAILTLEWNAWPGGSQNLHRAERLIADLRALTAPGKSRSLRRW